LHTDPDRIRTPMARGSDGQLKPVSWDEAFTLIDRCLTPIIKEHGPDAVAMYLGNPVVHDFATTLYASTAVRLLGTRNYYTANTVDAMPKFVVCQLMFGSMYTVPLPDLDRCSHVVIIGANPLVSNGSLLTAPGMRSKLRAVRHRGGRIIVIATCRCSRKVPTGARCKSIRPTPPVWHWAPTPESRPVSAQSRHASRSPTASAQAWCHCRTVGATTSPTP
jgi:anaerobic selenocysteine-containing dehydrogenase